MPKALPGTSQILLFSFSFALILSVKFHRAQWPVILRSTFKWGRFREAAKAPMTAFAVADKLVCGSDSDNHLVQIKELCWLGYAGLETKEGTKRHRRKWLPAASPASATQPGLWNFAFWISDCEIPSENPKFEVRSSKFPQPPSALRPPLTRGVPLSFQFNLSITSGFYSSLNRVV